jgi:lysozyme family protein
MMTAEAIAAGIVAREGGYVNDPDDPGGATNHGVTIGTMQRLGIDLTGDGRVTTADLRKLTREQAVRIYLDHYYTAPRLAELPEGLRAPVFDMYVNAGSNAVKLLQRLLNQMGQDVQVDGAVGPQTIRAAFAAEAMAAPDLLVDAYGVARRNYYYALADARPASRKYARRRDGGKGGWIVRAEEFISPRFHLTEAQHRARVAAWA